MAASMPRLHASRPAPHILCAAAARTLMRGRCRSRAAPVPPRHRAPRAHEQLTRPPPRHCPRARCAFRSIRTTLLFVRMVERMRRAVAHEYGLPLLTISPVQTFAAQFVSPEAAAQGASQGGGGDAGGKDAAGGLHADECSFKDFHYSAVLYLGTQGDDFEGGTFSFNDPSPGSAGDAPTLMGLPIVTSAPGTRVRCPLAPAAGAAVLFSSGWENMHEVAPLVSGVRLAVPIFFGTRPEGECDKDPSPGDPALAEELWVTLLHPRDGMDVHRFMGNWHWLLTVC
jgi:hypothetical protein